MTAARLGIALVLAIVVVACIPPRDRRPGLWLTGEAAQFPSDWSFADEHREIAIEVRTPYLLAHSVTIWCRSMDGRLYVGARAPETKRWPGWVDRDPNVRLGIGEQVFAVRLVPLDDPEEIESLRGAYAEKYDVPYPPREGSPGSRYWAVEPRA